MTWGLLAELALKSTLLAGGWLLVLHLLARHSAAERALIAQAGLLGLLLLPPVMLLGPKLPVASAGPLADLARSIPTNRGEAPISGFSPEAPSGLAEMPQTATAAWPFPALDLVTLVYLVPAILLLLAIAIGILRLGPIRRRAIVITDSHWLAALARAQQRLGLRHGVALLVSEEISSPLSWGIVRPVILLDQRTAGAPAQAETIIAHELAHVARLDWAKLLVARIAVALFWFNPLVWLLSRQCHQLCEEAADDAVLASEVKDEAYAELLIACARHDSKGLLLSANGVAPGRGSLQRRVDRILDEGSCRRSAAAGWAGSCAAIALIVAAPLAAVTPAQPYHLVEKESGILAVPSVAPEPDERASASPRSLRRARPSVTAGAEQANTGAISRPLPSAAMAGGPTRTLSLPRFSSFELEGQGEVLLRYGEVQQVRVTEGYAGSASVHVDGRGRLHIRGCGRGCTVDIATPAALAAVGSKGGGTIVAQGRFPRQESIAASVDGTGTVDLRALVLSQMVASVAGNGRILSQPGDALVASIIGEGEISYWGDPQVTTSLHGNGSVRRAGPG